jgi:8-oxo-dGTP pyrophosphatase MutT (NUDIX family)
VFCLRSIEFLQLILEAFIDKVKSALLQPLPGDKAHQSMMSYQRQSPLEVKKLDPPPKESAVMFLLFNYQNQWHTLFIQRPKDQSVHSGQLSFPGGKREAGESLDQTALRETFEEIGVAADQIEILGELSEIYIPPSHFLVRPFMGVMRSLPELILNPSEVEEVIIQPLDFFFQENIIAQKPIFIPRFNVTINAPFFDIQGRTLWGATAMMVQEFRLMMGVK